jgi:hypothetical protein
MLKKNAPTLASTALATVVMGFSPAAVNAAQVVALAGDKTLIMFDTENPSVSRTMDVSGVSRLAGIDLRPATGALVGVTSEHEVVEIDPVTGKATMKVKMKTPLPASGMPVIVDFNPAADKLRYMTGTTNHRVNVDNGDVTVDGSLAFESTDMHTGEEPAIVAAAYINSYGKPEKTAMYDIDSTIVALIRQTSPNDGTLAAVGKLGIADPGEYFAFDVQTTADGTNTAWLVTGDMLYKVDLETGKAMGVGEIKGAPSQIRDITILPAN